ncbi:MAG: HPF/RaiA family ribosome-associated protein [bacterium]|nr:HPF/RaiA family ribosome-associated protein [bacterium]
MKILHYEKNFHYTDRELLLVVRKIGTLATYCKRLKDDGSSIRIDVENRATKKERDQLKMMVTIEIPGKTLRAESRKSTITEAIERCCEKLEPQLKKYKDMHSKKVRTKKRA